MNHAEQRFCWLLEQRGYNNYWPEEKLEERIKVRKKRPDFYVETSVSKFLVEVKSLEKPGPGQLRKDKGGTFPIPLLLNRLANLVYEAAKQLRPYKSEKWPCLIVIDNWRQVIIPTAFLTLKQLFIDRQYQEDTRKYHRLSKDWHTYISAIAVNLSKEKFRPLDDKEERPMRVRIVHNPYADDTIKLPIEIFTDNDDEHHYYQDGTWIEFCPRRN